MADVKQERTLVANAEDMILVNFLRHCRTRHPLMRFLGQREHQKDHLRNRDLDHDHAPPRETDGD